MREQQTLLLLKQADKNALKMVYTENRTPFINFARTLGISDDDILDVYQDAIIVLQEKALKGEIDHLKCTIKTYLFGIGKYMLYEKTRKNNKKIKDFSLEKEDYNYKEISNKFLDDEPNQFQLLLQKAFTTLGKKCKEVLTLFYYRGYTIDEITDALNYDNKNVVKSQKSRCLKQLKEKIKTETHGK
ncbi:RNA polymerase sigma factor, sigma-70 family [Polaribacter sp. KT25b]|uniref:RNA polymerase sigma factor n=1 Tax=Polaribacter sp. KT25b TaxID=1855336 RepID=UPI00087D57F8|nr:sigma-70 family RNA polymerase sigma factor [Polaribacter sp. KT25b]SDR92392.1 RNA polymerase sigma factor, sigma-70 family [Polaribacter sp. KT25b]